MRPRTCSSQRPRRLRHTALPVVLVAALSTAACTSSPEQRTGASSGVPQVGGVLRNSIIDPGGQIDPVIVSSPGGSAIVDAVTEKLVRISPTFEATPALATHWAPAPDNLHWTFEIRRGVQFNNGSALTPTDVVATYERILAPTSTSPAKGTLSGVLRSVAAEANTVVFTLIKPVADFPFLLAGNNTQILPATYKPGSWQRNYIGTGPFTVSSFKQGQSATLTRNPTYWNADQIYLDTVEFKFFKDQQSRVLALQSGEIDGLYGEPVAANLTLALDKSRYTVTSDPNPGFSAVAFRVDIAPFDDVKVRQAIAWALDRNAIRENLYQDQAVLGNDTVYGPTYPIAPTGLTQRNADKSKVKELLGDRKVKFTLTTSSTEEAHALMIQQQLRTYDNFDVDVRILSAGEYYANGDSAPWLSAAATITYWSERPIPSPYNEYLYRSGAAWNASHYSNPALDSLFERYDASSDKAERAALVNQIAAIEWTDVPVVISAHPKSRSYLDPKVHLTHWPSVVNYAGAWIEH
ncbi:ABC transporter substrate-binding protein [Nocardia tengchongensis]|uniref:ABC transporter substrate-binding protein n=1 Tax=Nocardia tengchongensis TaxID=2055889 RepID=UPI0036A8C02F